jgi:TonB-dependent receptor
MSYSTRNHRKLAITAILLASAAVPGQAWAQTIVGTAIDSSATRALNGVEVELVELGRTESTSSDGSFRFSGVPAGTYTLIARYSGALPETQTVTVPATGEVTANFTIGAPGDDLILVVGQRANLASSISRQRAGEGVSTVLTRDAIGQFPDQNVAEALRRAPGINVLNDQGEGRFVSIRGLDPELNSTSINGNRVLATGGDQRAAALDVIPSELVESITIKKSLTPDMDADTLGGSVEIETATAFSRTNAYVGVSVEGSYSDLRDAWSPKAGIDFSVPLGSDFGVAGGLSYYDRRFSSDNIEMAGWGETDDGTVFAEEVDFRDYDVTRERIGANLSFDLRAGSTTELYLRGLYSRFDDTEFRRRLVFIFNEEPASGTANTATFDSADGRIEIRRDIKDRGEAQEIKTVSFGGNTEAGDWRFVYDAAYSQATQSEDNSVDPMRFRRRFSGAGQLGVTFDYSDPQIPAYSIDFGEAGFLDASSYQMTLLERTTEERAEDQEFALRADITRTIPLANGTFEIQGGAKARWREKELDFTIDVFDGFAGGLRLDRFAGPQSYGLALIDPVPGGDELRDFIDTNGYANFSRNDLESTFVSAAEDFRAKEDVYASYLLGRYITADLRVIAGVRMERTENVFFANRLDINEDAETLTITPVNFDRSYTDWLPSINVRFEPAADVVLRAAAFRSLVRPGIGSVAPRFIVEENEDGERSGEFGNPDLQPYRAWNFDAAVEYYFARDAAISFGGFYKSIDNFIVTGEFDNLTFNGITVDEGTVPLNGESATVKGLEFSYQQALTFLPEPLDGFLVNFNYTFTDAEGQLADGDLTTGRFIPLPASAKHTFNAVLGYEKGPISLRAAGAYRSSYLDEVGDDPMEDRYVADHFQVDFTAKYRVTPNVQLIGEFINAFDEPYYAYQSGPSGRRLLQYEEYSWTAKIGVKANF